MGKIVRQGVEYGGSSNSADCIKYNDTKSVKEAIDEIKASSSSNPTASSVTFNNTDTGLAATNVQDAITEVNGNLKGQIITKSYKKSITVTSYGYFTDITNVAVEGYTPLGIVEINSGTFVNAVGTFTVIDNTASIQFRCVTSDGFNGNYSFKVLYSKN